MRRRAIRIYAKDRVQPWVCLPRQAERLEADWLYTQYAGRGAYWDCAFPECQHCIISPQLPNSKLTMSREHINKNLN
jgi:hypothetical protein